MFQITKHQVDQFVPGRRVPSCQLYVKWIGEQEQPVELVHRVELLGAKEPFDFFMIDIPPPQGCVESLLHTVMRKRFWCMYVNTVTKFPYTAKLYAVRHAIYPVDTIGMFC